MCEREIKRKGEGRGEEGEKEGRQAGRQAGALRSWTPEYRTPASRSVQVLLAFQVQNEGSGPDSLSDCLTEHLPSLLLG